MSITRNRLNSNETPYTFSSITYPSAGEEDSDFIQFKCFEYNSLPGDFGRRGTSAGAPRRLDRISTNTTNTVSLYLPPQLSYADSVTWEGKDMSAKGTGMMFQKLGRYLSNSGGIRTTIGALTTGNARGSVEDRITKETGQVVNPNTELMFEKTELRSFSLNFTLFARNSDDTRTIRDIIRVFRANMYPVFEDEWLRFPKVWNVSYYSRSGDTSEYLFKYFDCALTDFKTDMGNDDEYFIKFANGAPAAITIELSFKELVLLTRRDIESNY
jgi:hypothetical protein